MFSVANLLDRAKEKGGLESDYRLAKVLRINQTRLSNYRHGRSLPDADMVEALCALSGDDAGMIAAQVEAARAKEGPVRTMWLSVAARLQGVAGHAQPAILAALFAIALIAGYASPAKAAQLVSVIKPQVTDIYIVSTGRIGRVCNFLLVRLRQFALYFGLCGLAAAG